MLDTEDGAVIFAGGEGVWDGSTVVLFKNEGVGVGTIGVDCETKTDELEEIDDGLGGCGLGVGPSGSIDVELDGLMEEVVGTDSVGVGPSGSTDVELEGLMEDRVGGGVVGFGPSGSTDVELNPKMEDVVGIDGVDVEPSGSTDVDLSELTEEDRDDGMGVPSPAHGVFFWVVDSV